MNIGETLQERYHIEQVLGQGGMGTTYKALDLETTQPVAIKQLHLSHLQDWKMLELFEREAKVLQQIEYPNIPNYIEYFSVETETDVEFFLVQEYIEGKTLKQMIEEGWRGSEAEILAIFRQLVNILDYLHNLRPPVIHRDINPKNIILSPRGSTTSHSKFDVYLVDFGAVQERIRTTWHGGSTMIGTFGYVPLEQFNGHAVPASDYYALGATLLYLLTHRHPADFETEDLKPKFRDVVTASPQLIRLLDGLLEPSPKKRLSAPQTVEAVLQKTPATSQTRLKKTSLPYGTKIKRFRKSSDKIHIRIPGKINAGTLFMFGFSLFWLIFVTVWTGGAAIGGGVFALFSIPFWIVGFGMFGAAIYNMFGRTTLELTPEWIQVHYKLSGLGISRRVPTTSIDNIEVSTWYTKNKQPVEGISMHAGAKTLKFGSQLSASEKAWVIEEVENYILEYGR